MHGVEADAVAGGASRLVLHLRVVHGAHPEHEPDAWHPERGTWPVTLFPTTAGGSI